MSKAAKKSTLDKDQIKQWFASLKPSGSDSFNPRAMLAGIGIKTVKDVVDYLKSPESPEYKAVITSIRRNEAIKKLLENESYQMQQEQNVLDHSILTWLLRRFFTRHSNDNQQLNAAYQQQIDNRLQSTRQNRVAYSSHEKADSGVRLSLATYDTSEEAAQNILDATLEEAMQLEQELLQIHQEHLEINSRYITQNNELNRLDALYIATPGDPSAVSRIMQRLAQLSPAQIGVPLENAHLEHRYLNDALSRFRNDHQMHSENALPVNDYSKAALFVPRIWKLVEYQGKIYLFQSSNMPENLSALPQVELESAHSLYLEKRPDFMTARYFMRHVRSQELKILEDRKVSAEQKLSPMLQKMAMNLNMLQQIQAGKVDAHQKLQPVGSPNVVAPFTSSYDKMLRQFTQAPTLAPGIKVIKAKLPQQTFMPSGSSEDMRKVMQAVLNIGFTNNGPLSRRLEPTAVSTATPRIGKN